MGMSPEGKKRKAPYDPIRDVRPQKSSKTIPEVSRFEFHPSYMATVTIAMRPENICDEPQVVDVQVLGTFTHLEKARSTLLEALKADFKTPAAPTVRMLPNEIHRDQNLGTGRLCIVQCDLPAVSGDTPPRTGWLRIGEVFPKEAMNIQKKILSSSIFIVFETQQQYGEEFSSIVAVYRFAHEANQHVIKEFNNYGGLANVRQQRNDHRHRPNRDADTSEVEDEVEEEESEEESDYGDDDDNPSASLSFQNGFAKAKVRGEDDWTTWQVLQKTVL